MSAILKVKVPFFRRKTSGGSNGIGTFYLAATPQYLPTLNQTCLITHTNVATNSGLSNKLSAISTNVVTGKFQSFEQLTSTSTASTTDNYTNFFVIAYDDASFSINQFSGDCAGYIEYDVNPATYQVLKPVENVVIVNENVPFDGDLGYTQLFCATGATSNDPKYGVANPPVFPGMFVRLDDNNTIFANLLKSLNLPVSEEERRKYDRSELGILTATTDTTNPAAIQLDGNLYTWAAVNSYTTGVNLTVHPTTGYTGAYYGTALQSIGSTDYFTTSNSQRVKDNSKMPQRNQVALVFEIPQDHYGEIIDGKTIHLKLPYWNITGTDDTVNIFSFNASEVALDIYATYNKSGSNLDLATSEQDLSMISLGARPDLTNLTGYESNVVPLFCDTVKPPLGNVSSSWGEAYADVIDGAKVFTSNSRNNNKNTYNYNVDEAIGVAYLDKGFIVITHPKIVDALFTKAFGGTITNGGLIPNSTYYNKQYNFQSPTNNNVKALVKTVPGGSVIRTIDSSSDVEWDNTQWVFTDSVTTNTELEFLSYNSEKSLNVVCLASADEFYKSTNPTAKELMQVDDAVDFATFKSADANLYPVMITQIGIHDAQGNLLAVCKPTQPVKKYWFDVVSFNVKIKL